VREDGKVQVEKEHVETVVNLIYDLIDAWALDRFVLHKRDEEELTEEERERIENTFRENPKLEELFRLIARMAHKRLSVNEYAGHLKVSRRTIQNWKAQLEELGLVTARERSRGYILTPKGRAYYHEKYVKKHKQEQSNEEQQHIGGQNSGATVQTGETERRGAKGRGFTRLHQCTSTPSPHIVEKSHEFKLYLQAAARLAEKGIVEMHGHALNPYLKLLKEVG